MLIDSVAPAAVPSRVSDTGDAAGWGELAAGGLEIREIEGDHYSLLRDPHVEELAAGLREVLESYEGTR